MRYCNEPDTGAYPIYSVDQGDDEEVLKKKYFSPPPGMRISTCYFCDCAGAIAGVDVQRHMLEEHLEQCFQCIPCGRVVCADTDTAQRHLREGHGLANADQTTLLASLRLPVDLRQVKCIQCGRLFMGQGLSVALEHLNKIHGGNSEQLPNDSLLVSCRACGTRIVGGEEEFATHTTECLVLKKEMMTESN